MPRLAKKLTDAVVRQAVHKARRYELSDAGTGLVLRVEARPSPQKIWQVRYRTSGSQQRRMRLGTFPTVPLSDARAKAAAIRAEAGLSLLSSTVVTSRVLRPAQPRSTGATSIAMSVGPGARGSSPRSAAPM